MRLVRQLSLYMALALGANAAFGADLSALESLRAGDMKKLVLHAAPKPVSDAVFFLEDDGGTATLADYQGKYVLLNFWATWCAPCRKEMPMLSELQKTFGGETFEVLTLASGRNSPAGIRKFLDGIGVENLPRHQDPKGDVARDMAVFGLPITVILDPKGNEIGRLRGEADWSSDSAHALIAALLDGA
ncbi:TlpA family protein disulfide reductase [Tritonibacter horizontis]|uniref:Thiol:disulfide interchange protein TlpA n=1 Tax=Tritonibacter horizontis TaxID=1768241 RepID=A0A132BXD7_9RHOB|nr:TlpA disulfide reductase family protein [Tritonibacter horizontis]KUP93053.1 thiol:disulfide interchange protein TlpA [Tritonibacter horizontis]